MKNKNVALFSKGTYDPFFVLLRFKNHISQMFAVLVNTLTKTFAKVVHNSSDHFL